MDKHFKQLSTPLTASVINEPFSLLPKFLKDFDIHGIKTNDILEFDESKVSTLKQSMEPVVKDICEQLSKMDKRRTDTISRVKWNHDAYERNFRDRYSLFVAKNSKEPNKKELKEIESNVYHFLKQANKLENEARQYFDEYQSYIKENLALLIRFYILRLREYEIIVANEIHVLREPKRKREPSGAGIGMVNDSLRANFFNEDIEFLYREIKTSNPEKTIWKIACNIENRLKSKNGLKPPKRNYINSYLKEKYEK